LLKIIKADALLVLAENCKFCSFV